MSVIVKLRKLSHSANRSVADEAEKIVHIQCITDSPAPNQPRIKILSEGTGIARLFRALRKKIYNVAHNSMEKKISADLAQVQHIKELSAAAAVQAEQPFPLWKIVGSDSLFLSHGCPVRSGSGNPYGPFPNATRLYRLLDQMGRQVRSPFPL